MLEYLIVNNNMTDYRIDPPREYLAEVEANENYVADSVAPTMGARHTFSEFRTVWKREPVMVERLTALNYLRTLMEEFRWGEREPFKVEIIPVDTTPQKCLNDPDDMPWVGEI